MFSCSILRTKKFVHVCLLTNFQPNGSPNVRFLYEPSVLILLQNVSIILLLFKKTREYLNWSL
ncbi:hypothetical protein HanIR_Chr06g0274141 [Helianthus annuus]|nr:hypothetical protein HanIR_Chr06g0274141 [Helianthus annuus]